MVFIQISSLDLEKSFKFVQNKIYTTMNFGSIYKQVINLIINPKTEWENIKTEKYSRTLVLKIYALPLILALAICTIIGNMLYTSRLTMHPSYPLLSGVAMFVIVFGGTYLSAMIINELTPSFNSTKDINATFNLIVYSLSAFYIFSSLAYILPEPFFQVRYFGIYSLYLFWLGSSSLLSTPTDNKVGFTFVSALIVLGIYSIMNLVFSQIINGFYGLSLIQK
jgi:hypothetical protein